MEKAIADTNLDIPRLFETCKKVNGEIEMRSSEIAARTYMLKSSSQLLLLLHSVRGKVQV